MKTNSKWMAGLTVAFLISFLGCSKKEDETQETPSVEAESSRQISVKTAQDQPDDNGNTQVAVQDTSLSDVVALWDTDQKDTATAKFLSINWQDKSALSQIRCLSMSEADLMSLSEDDRNSIVQETISLFGSMGKLFRHVASEAESLAGSGNTAKAKEYLDSIRQCGNSLSEPDHFDVVRMRGRAWLGFAETKLSEIK